MILIYQEAWKDFLNSTRLVYRLAPLAVMFQFQTGLRLGELCAVKFDDVENGVLHVVRMLQRDSDKVVEHTKSHEDRDELLTDAALELIEVSRAYQEEHGGKGEYVFSMTEDKRTNPLAVKGKTASVRFSRLKKRNQALAVSKVIKFTRKGQGKVTYAKSSGNKKITINKKTGKVTVKKGLKKGTYKVKVKITAAGTSTYKKATKTTTFKIKVK